MNITFKIWQKYKRFFSIYMLDAEDACYLYISNHILLILWGCFLYLVHLEKELFIFKCVKFTKQMNIVLDDL